jgi:hypothetical protein
MDKHGNRIYPAHPTIWPKNNTRGSGSNYLQILDHSNRIRAYFELAR